MSGFHPGAVKVISLLAGAACLLLTGCKRAEADTAKLDEARQTFVGICSRCHGADGKGGIAAGTTSAPRNFVDPAFQASRKDDELMAAIKNGKGAMPAFGAIYGDDQIAALVQVVRGFNPKK
jgi:mono/diheme cytochrome c family protein